MAIPPTAVRYTLSGQTVGGEIFATSIWTTGRTVTSQSDANLLASTMATTFNGIMSLWDVYIDASTKWTGVKAYCYPQGGPAAEFIGEAVLNKTGQSTAAPLPLQCALVVTLGTGNAGRSYRGRCYLPCSSADLQGDTHQFVLSDVQTIANQFAQFLHDVQFNNAGTPVVLSKARSAATEILTVSVDTRLDIQRRRAAQQSITARYSADVPAQ